MSNTTFFQEAAKENSSLSWKDIFSESFVRHSRADRELAMQVGTLRRQVPVSRMLQTWHRPWLWWPAAQVGLGLVLVLYAAYWICISLLGGAAVTLGHMMMIIPPVVLPLIMLVFLWELNIPQNISFMDLLAYFAAGGILAFVFTSVMFLPVPTYLPASTAALREEPAKLGATLLILLYVEKKQKKRICGITALVVGAAVGAAFSGIESVSYAIMLSGSMQNMISNQITRALFSVAGHIAYCVPYATAIGLHAEHGRVTAKSVFNLQTILAFLCSIAMHALWNASFGGILKCLLLVAVAVVILLYWIKAALREIVRICLRSGGAMYRTVGTAAAVLTLICGGVVPGGIRFQSRGEPVVVGREQGRCNFCLGGGVKGISRQHCRIYRTPGGWVVEDLNSTYGTYVRGRRLMPGQPFPIQPGDHIFLGSRRLWLTVQ